MLLKDGQTVDLVDGRIADGDITSWNNKLNVDGSNATNEGVTTMMKKVASGTGSLSDGSSYFGDSNSDHTQIVRRPVLDIWNYIKGQISSVLGLTSSSYSGKADTAGTADKAVADNSGNNIEETYATKTETENTYQKKLTFDTTPTAGSSNPVTSDGIKTALDLKANASNFTAHIGDTTVHITPAERTAWNAKASTSVATTSANGLMSKTDKAKLDGISSGANKADVSYASKKLTKTINGTTTDVVAASTIIRDTNTFGNFAAVTDVTVSNIKFHTYWQVAPTSSNQVYGFAVHPTTGKLYRVYNNKGAYSVYGYDTDTTYSFDGTYNSSTNKAATVSSVTTRIATAKNELDAAIGKVDAKGIVINEIDGENVICFE